MRNRNAKGISPLLATVLLVGMTVAIIVIAILWGRSYIEEMAAKRGAIAEKQAECQNVDFTAVKEEPKCGLGVSDCQIDITLKNQGSVSIDKFTARVISKDGKAGVAVELKEALPSLGVAPYSVPVSSELIPLGTTDITKILSKVEVIPSIRVAQGQYVPCSGKKISVKVK